MLGLLARLDPKLLGVWTLALAGCQVDLLDPFAATDELGEDSSHDEGDGLVSSSESGDHGGDAGDATDTQTDQDDGEPPLFDVLEDDQPNLSSCGLAASVPSHLGCEFFGVDLDQAGLADYDPYGFVIINPNDRPVAVSIERYVAHGWLVSESATLEAHETHVFLPSDIQKLTTGLFESAVLRIRSDHPVVAIQASPAAYHPDDPGFSASATLLQPSSGWTNSTRVAGWRTHVGVAEDAFVGIVTVDDATPINVDLSFDVAPGPNDQPDAWLDPIATLVGAGQLLRLSAEPDPDRGIAGTRVWSGQEHRSAVFSVHSCAAIPDYQGTCGHVQEQLAAGLMGRHFVAPRLLARVDGEGDDVPDLIYEPTMIQVVADEPGTEVTVFRADGQIIESVTIDPDEPWTIEQLEYELAIVTDKPVVVAALMTNASFTELGSSSMVQLAPVEQWRTSHWVWVPQGFTSHLVMSGDGIGEIEVTAMAGVPLALGPDEDPDPDPAPVPSSPTVPIADTTVEADGLGLLHSTRWQVGPGIYRVDSGTPTSVVVVSAREHDGLVYLGGWGPSLVDFGPPT